MTTSTQTNKSIILAVADGTLSVSRIKRIIKCLSGVEVPPSEIAAVTQETGIPTPHREPTGDLRDQYPDTWSILLEARTFWVRVRRYWGDDAATELFVNLDLASLPAFYPQFPAYTTAAIYDRKQIDLNARTNEPLELESLYPLEAILDNYCHAYELEFAQNPGYQPGAKFPLPSDDYHAFQEAKWQEDCLRVYDTKFPKGEESLVAYFSQFWQEVRDKRGQYYFDNLRISLAGSSESSLSNRPFYSATRNNFRHFLHNLNGFRTKAPWRVVVMHDPERRLPMELEGALFKHGWQKLESLVVLGILSVDQLAN